MTLELKKKQLELMKVECGKQEMLLRVFESQENIERLNQNIEIQDKRILELKEEIKELSNKKD